MIPLDATTASRKLRAAAAKARGRADDTTRTEIAQHNGNAVQVQKPEAVIAARNAADFEAIARLIEKAGGAP